MLELSLYQDRISHYFVALGLMRLLGPDTQGWWANHGFVLDAGMTREELLDFFMTKYRPTPMFAPWNRGGFGMSTNKEIISQLEKTTDPRFEEARSVIKIIRSVLDKHVREGDLVDKFSFIQELRGTLPEPALPFVDLIFVAKRPRDKDFSLLFNSGGNDGNFDTAINFWWHLLNNPSVESLDSLLFGSPQRGQTPLKDKSAGGLFLRSAGGQNSSSSPRSYSNTLNPWEYILMMEGMLSLQAGMSKRAGTRSQVLSFTTHGESLGFASSAESETPKGEFWAPIWTQPASWPEISKLFSDGRVLTKKDDANSFLSFSHALSGLGVDRSIESFMRWGLVPDRTGLSMSCVLLGVWSTGRNKDLDGLRQLVFWSPPEKEVESLIRSRLVRAYRSALTQSLQTQDPRHALDALGKLWDLGQASSKIHLPPLDFRELQPLLDTLDTPEYRLAKAFASKWGKLFFDFEKKGSPETRLSAFARWTHVKGHNPFETHVCELSDIQEFLDGSLDETTLMGYVEALSVLDWNKPDGQSDRTDVVPLDSFYVGFKLAQIKKPSAKFMPLLCAGKVREGFRIAQIVLEQNDIDFKHHLQGQSPSGPRLACALLFPVSVKELFRHV